MRHHYVFISRWIVPAPVERCWDLYEEALASGVVPWWPAVRVEPSVARPGVGDLVRLEVRSPWGYRLRVALTITEALAPVVLAATSIGDLTGRGRLELAPCAVGARPAAEGAALVWRWEVELDRRWMRIASPVLRPAFVLAHGLVMRRGRRGLVTALAARSDARNAGNRVAARRPPRRRRYRGVP